jgi:CheY-like chemotaxis protein
MNVTDDIEVEAGDYLQISVMDAGAGMTPEVLARAAEPFFTTKGVGKGTGLGLSTVYGIARQSGGTVRLESALEKGTTVNLLLRCLPAPVIDVPSNSNDDWRDQEHVEPATILVVDDDDQVRTSLTDSLIALGHRVITAAGGKDALAALQASEPDLMLLDFAMPGMNGAEVAKRARERWPVLPIVFASGYADTAALEAVIGPDTPMLRKPFTVNQLSRVLSRELGRAA